MTGKFTLKINTNEPNKRTYTFFNMTEEDITITDHFLIVKTFYDGYPIEYSYNLNTITQIIKTKRS